jgi:hypothetical protein
MQLWKCEVRVKGELFGSATALDMHDAKRDAMRHALDHAESLGWDIDEVPEGLKVSVFGYTDSAEDTVH